MSSSTRYSLLITFIFGIKNFEHKLTKERQIFPDNLWNLTKLKELNLAYVNIERIPEGIKNLINLECLHINNLQISDFSNIVGRYPSLAR